MVNGLADCLRKFVPQMTNDNRDGSRSTVIVQSNQSTKIARFHCGMCTTSHLTRGVTPREIYIALNVTQPSNGAVPRISDWLGMLTIFRLMNR